jgi:hypothetical protein
MMMTKKTYEGKQYLTTDVDLNTDTDMSPDLDLNTDTDMRPDIDMSPDLDLNTDTNMSPDIDMNSDTLNPIVTAPACGLYLEYVE